MNLFSPLAPARSRAARHFRRTFTTTAAWQADFTHVVIGGGVVGLAVARSLAARGGTSTVLLERHHAIGTETSSRNSEVIHAGIYYPPTSLKTKLCIQGRHLLYDYCARRSVGHKKIGKWIVAADVNQRAALESVAAHCASPDISVPTRWVSRAEASRLEPEIWAGFEGDGLGQGERAILESPETGIVDSHGLMLALQGEFEDSGGETVLGANVIGVTPLGHKGSAGWEVTVRDKDSSPDDEPTTITAEVLVNAAGLGATDIHNLIVPTTPDSPRTFYAKGNYFSYVPPPSSTPPKVGRLIYPAPTPGFAGLGTHLTLDLAGQIRFGPDVEWVDSEHELGASSDPATMEAALAAVGRYLPRVVEEGGELKADYAGIRPKLGRMGDERQGRGFVDFVVRREEGFEGWVNLLGIESPGLTSSLAIGEMVEGLLYGRGR